VHLGCRSASLLGDYKVTGRERNRLLHLVERQDEPAGGSRFAEVDADARYALRLERRRSRSSAPNLYRCMVLSSTADYVAH